MTPLNVNLQQLIEQIDHDLLDADPVTKISEARLRGRTLVDLGDQLVDHYVHAARAGGTSWSQIGDALGVSKQAAQQRRADGQFEQYTGRARHVVILAQERARALKHDHIGTEHLLLGLIGEPEGLAAKVLAVLAGSLETVSTAVHERLTPGATKPGSHLTFTPTAKQALQETVHVAMELGHNFIGTEHLLLGVLRAPESLGAQVLTDLGVDFDKARQAVIAALMGVQHQRRS
jgi:hypothetical protein